MQLSDTYNFTTIEWILAIVAAMCIGLSKTGLSGLSILTIAIFARIIPPKESSGLVLPLLICADVVAVFSFKRHAHWNHLWKIFPWAGAGVVIGFFALKHIDERAAQHLIGSILLIMVSVQLWRQFIQKDTLEELPKWLAPIIGLAAGFSTMIANAAGPIMVLYLLAAGLPKMELIGTGAWFFFVINLFKVPFSLNLGFINERSVLLNALLAPVTVASAFLGMRIVKHINQTVFNYVTLIMALCGSLNLLLSR